MNRIACIITVAAVMTLTPLAAAHADTVDPYTPIVCADVEVLVGTECINPEPEPTNEPTTAPTPEPTVEPSPEPTPDPEPTCAPGEELSNGNCTTPDPANPDPLVCTPPAVNYNGTCYTGEPDEQIGTPLVIDNPERDDVLAMTGSTTNTGGWALLLAIAIGAGISYMLSAFHNHRKATR